MKPAGKETVSGQLNTADRFSDLPVFILHHIISFLDTKEAYRTSILSKRWAHISATNPILDFRYYCKAKNSPTRHWPSKEVSASLLENIDTRMQRYDNEKLRIRTLRLSFAYTYEELGSEVEELGSEVEELEFSHNFKELSSKVDEWIRIAVCNQVATLSLDGPINYQLPDILLSAKSLRQLDCIKVKIPYYNGAINLASLQTLELLCVDVEERMLNHIISSCMLLKCLSIKNCSGFKTIVIPCYSQVKELTLRDALPENGTIILETSCLMYFKLFDNYDDGWPVMSKLGLLRNLRTLDIVFTGITDKEFGKLLPELASLENLRLTECDKLTMVRISSIQLKKIFLDCFGLLEVTIDAPSLTKFEYKGEFYPHRAITISSQASCDISLGTTPDCLDNEGFFKLKKLMTGLRSCNALEIWLENYTDESVCDAIEFNEEELGDVNLGLSHDITELKLNLYYMKLSRSSVSAFLNGIFWTCHPDIISLRFQLKDPDLMIQLFMSELEDMANCWRHHLKWVEFPSANCSNFLKSEKVDVRLRW